MIVPQKVSTWLNEYSHCTYTFSGLPTTAIRVPGLRSEDELERLIQNAKQIVQRGWQPAFWMIDKSAQELNAIKEGSYQLNCTTLKAGLTFKWHGSFLKAR
jgi:cell division protein YceG involved in septum cleavage